jgi:hypothetical protein
MITLLTAVAFPTGLLAYVGPGPGLTMLAALVGMLATLAIALWTVALWPVRVMLRRRREARDEPGVGTFHDH